MDLFKRVIAGSLLMPFMMTTAMPAALASGMPWMPPPGTMVMASPAYMPVMIKGLKVHPENPLLFDFILDTGKSHLKIDGPEFKVESRKLIKYFLASLTIKEDDLWVNLSPYEKDRMITDDLGKTELGRDMLAQDYILKQLTASMIYPEKELGKAFWNRVYARVQEQFGSTDVPIDTFNKVWIVADKARVLEHDNAAYVVGSHLKVMLESDYEAMSHQKDMAAAAKEPSPLWGGNGRGAQELAKQVIRDIVIPEIEKEVNEGRNFAPLRQMFFAMILASWYKRSLKNALLNQVYANKARTGGVRSDDPAVKEKIYEQYLQAYKQGVFNYIKEDVDAQQQPAPRRYFSGGEDFAMLKNGPEVTQDMAQGRGLFTGTTVEVRARMDKAQGPDAARPIPLDVLEKLKKSTVIESAIKIVADNYPEMRWLTGDVHATPEGIVAATQGRSISEKLFGANHIEFNRTAVGIMTLLWVLNDDYESFTASQNPAVRLTRKSFEELRAYTEHILNNKPEALDAMITYMLTFDALIAYTVINDLGKIESVVEMVKKESGVEEVDHDKILAIALEHHPEISTSFNRLADGYKRMILTGLKANFNFGQFIQGENVPASLSGLIGLDKEAFDFYMLHVIYDIAGAAGHVKEAGSLIVTEPTYQGFKQGIDALDKLNAGASMVTAYDDFLEAKGAGLGLDVHTPVERAVIRLCAMLRITDKEKARQVLEALDLLAPNERVILEKELNITGVDDGYATLLYYAPATLANLITALEKAGDPQPFAGALRMGLRAFARTFQLARIALKGRSGNGVFIVNISKLAEAAKMPQEFETAAIDLQTVGRDVDALVTQPAVIDVSKFPRLGALAEIPGQKVIPIGIGGGSDVIQAALLGDLLEKAGKTVPAIISVRTVKIGSQGVVGEIGGQRTVQGHGGEIAPGVYKILPTTTGSGRFLENLPSSSVPVFLVLDAEDGTLTEKIKAVVTHVGGADTVVSVDTGGDALHMTGGTSDVARATPDQDLRVLLALNDIGTPVVTAEVATGVDSPRYAQQVLGKANARFYQLSDMEKECVFAKYRDWQMDGAPDGIKKGNYGKTPFAWQKALHGATGWQCLPLPEGIVLDNKNPWDPFVFISKSVEGIFFMDLKDHLKAIQDKALDAAMLSSDDLPALLTIVASIPGNDQEKAVAIHRKFLEMEVVAVPAAILTIGFALINRMKPVVSSPRVVAAIVKNYQALLDKVVLYHKKEEVQTREALSPEEAREIAAWLAVATVDPEMNIDKVISISHQPQAGVDKVFDLYARYDQKREWAEMRVFTRLQAALLTVAQSQPGVGDDQVIKEYFEWQREMLSIDRQASPDLVVMKVFGLHLAGRKADHRGEDLYRDAVHAVSRKRGVRGFFDFHLFVAAMLQSPMPAFDRYHALIEEARASSDTGIFYSDHFKDLMEKSLQQVAASVDAPLSIYQALMQSPLDPSLDIGRRVYAITKAHILKDGKEGRKAFGIAKGRRPGLGGSIWFYGQLSVVYVDKEDYYGEKGDLLFSVDDQLQLIMRPSGLLIDGQAKPYRFIAVPYSDEYFLEYETIISNSMQGVPNLRNVALLMQDNGGAQLDFMMAAIKKFLKEPPSGSAQKRRARASSTQYFSLVAGLVKKEFSSPGMDFTPRQIAEALQKIRPINSVRPVNEKDVLIILKKLAKAPDGVEHVPDKKGYWRNKTTAPEKLPKQATGRGSVPEKGDAAQEKNIKGGVDLNARHMGLDVARDGKGVEMELDPAMIADFQRGDFSGVVPFIIRITPVQDPLAMPAAWNMFSRNAST